jgi:hypothetical protein
MIIEERSNEPQLNIPTLSGMLPMYDVEELNKIITELNDGEIDLYDCIGRVWNTAYFIGINQTIKVDQLNNPKM